jgi:hypothetical protein
LFELEHQNSLKVNKCFFIFLGIRLEDKDMVVDLPQLIGVRIELALCDDTVMSDGDFGVPVGSGPQVAEVAVELEDVVEVHGFDRLRFKMLALL